MASQPQCWTQKTSYAFISHLRFASISSVVPARLAHDLHEALFCPYWTLFRQPASGLRSLNTAWPLRPSLAVLRHWLLVQGSGTGPFPSGLKAHLPRLIPATFSCLHSPLSSAFSISTCTSGSHLSSLFHSFPCAPSNSRAHSICTGSELQEVKTQHWSF